MKTVHKYALVEGRNNNLSMPRGAVPLTVQVQNSWPMLWAEVDTAQPLQHRSFLVIGTGMEIMEEVKQYIGSVQMGALVWHVFEVVSAKTASSQSLASLISSPQLVDMLASVA